MGGRGRLWGEHRENGAQGHTEVDAAGIVEMNVYLKDFHQNTVKITIEITVLGSLTSNVLPVFKFYYYNLCRRKQQCREFGVLLVSL